MNQAWGVPDWRGDEAYQAYEDLERDDYRWQFLRRMPAYRADWVNIRGGRRTRSVRARHG
jgi:Family of unknown function (DUF6499)